MKYILGLAIDFTVLAQQVEGADPLFQPLAVQDTEVDLFNRYPLVEQRGGTQANTLTIRVGKAQFGIRQIEELVANAFHKMGRSKFPSAYVYNTGQWAKFKDLLCLCFRLSESGRLALIQRLFDYGLEKLDYNIYYSTTAERTRVFDQILSSYPRVGEGENGGLAMQAMIYGWCMMMFPHLQIDADKVRTGSRRQRRFGDIDGYLGLTLMISVEVKDIALDEANYDKQVRPFADLVKENGIHGVMVAQSFSDGALALMESEGLVGVSLDEILRSCRVWDWQRQESALQAMQHYLAHVEQNPTAVRRLLAFIKTVDPDRE